MNRRRFVLVAGTAGMVGVAGCLGFGDDDENGDGDDEDGNGDANGDENGDEPGTNGDGPDNGGLELEFGWDPEEPEAGDEVVFEATGTHEFDMYYWVLPSGIDATADPATTHTFEMPGEYTVRLQAVDEFDDEEFEAVFEAAADGQLDGAEEENIEDIDIDGLDIEEELREKLRALRDVLDSGELVPDIENPEEFVVARNAVTNEVAIGAPDAFEGPLLTLLDTTDGLETLANPDVSRTSGDISAVRDDVAGVETQLTGENSPLVEPIETVVTYQQELLTIHELELAAIELVGTAFDAVAGIDDLVTDNPEEYNQAATTLDDALDTLAERRDHEDNLDTARSELLDQLSVLEDAMPDPDRGATEFVVGDEPDEEQRYSEFDLDGLELLTTASRDLLLACAQITTGIEHLEAEQRDDAVEAFEDATTLASEVSDAFEALVDDSDMFNTVLADLGRADSDLEAGLAAASEVFRFDRFAENPADASVEDAEQLFEQVMAELDALVSE